tara:strand:- start:575 stop:835 length:261 start_codon:yes stop_codon:yes gene_type:complete
MEAQMAKFDELKAEAVKLGIPTSSGAYKPKDQAWGELAITEWELHRRIKEEQRHRRESKLWVVAVVSAAASVVSALVALCALLILK